MNIETYFKISYGLYVISAKHNGKMNGYIANTAFQVTAVPAQIAIACNKDNFTANLISQSGAFSISILKKETSAQTLGTFGYKSGRDIEKFSNVNYITGSLGTPILTDDSLAWFECRLTNTFDVGTHYIFVGEVAGFDLLDEIAEPLTYAYFREVKKGKAPKNAPTYIAPEAVKPEKINEIYYCPACGYIYDPLTGDPEHGIPAGTEFKNLPDNWTCPNCGAEKNDFTIK